MQHIITMENIKKQIYTLPEIRRVTLPLWPAWAVTAVGLACGLIALLNNNIPAAYSSDLICFALLGCFSLILTLLYYLVGDSHRPYHRNLHKILEPELTYYAPAEQQHIIDALNAHDEKALSSIKKNSQPQLVLMRYSDKEETIFYSQLLRATTSRQMEPLTEIIINNINK